MEPLVPRPLPDFIPQLWRKIESYLISHLLKSPVTRPGSDNTRVQSNATIECPHASTTDGITVEPPNRGHFGIAAFVLSSEVVLFSEVV